LADAGRRPPWLALVEAGGVERQVRLAVLAREIRPEIDRRTAALRQQYEMLGKVGEQEEALQGALGRQRVAARAARERFASLEAAALARAEKRGAEAVTAGDRILQRGERATLLASETQRRQQAARLAGQLAALPSSEQRPVPAQGPSPSPPLKWSPPATGALIVGAGELLPNGVRARGLTIAAARGTQVVAPANGRVVFAGPFRRREGIVILDHGGGWMTLLGDVRPSVKVGERVERGSAVGRALGPVTVELFRDGRAEPAALIARSS
jgi:septal ring factor EnvC (AmiA/AmiB activator)